MPIYSCFPLITFLHVPGKMSEPLWLMMGTAFQIVPPPLLSPITPSIVPFSSDKGVGGRLISYGNPTNEERSITLTWNPARHYFLTTKHTFLPWNHSKDASAIKIPVDCRKQRYVIGRIYNISVPPLTNGGIREESTASDSFRTSGVCTVPCGPISSSSHCVRAIPKEFLTVSLIATHPHLDVALLSAPISATFTPSSSSSSGLQQVSCFQSPLVLSSNVSPNGTSSSWRAKSGSFGFVGYRAEGQLGELDTFDATLLERLTVQERTTLMNELKNVEGKQVGSYCKVKILSTLGAAAAVDGGKCYHGMSGSPLIDWEKNECIGILYGKHTEYPQHIGYTPVQDFYPWVKKVIAHIPS